MKMQKSTILVLAVVAGIVVLIGLIGFLKYGIGDKMTEIGSSNEQIVGGDRDTHGCIGSAGYSWCEEKGKCLREWEEPCEASSAESPLDATYRFGDEFISLTNGIYEREAAPGSAAKETFRIFGVPKEADLDKDGDTDAALWLTQSGGGSGTFYFIALALNENGRYIGTNAMLLGDRIAPQNITIDGDRAVANFAERNPGEPFTTQPSLGKSVRVHLDPTTKEIGEWVKDFEGEADPSRMTLEMTTWNWIKTTYTDGKNISPKQEGKFTLTFKDGQVSIGTDCNNMRGSYSAKGTMLEFGPLMSTRMYCEGSQETEFSVMLAEVSDYRFSSRGELILELKEGKGSMVFR